MNHDKRIGQQKLRRRRRVRRHIRGTTDRPRLNVFRSHKHIYCQLIDDSNGRTLVSASTRDKDLIDSKSYGGNCDAATLVGKALADRAKEAGVKQVCFDRGHYKFHGRIAALAAAARENGLDF